MARAKPLVPDGAWPLLLAARSLRGDGSLIADPNWRRALVLAPHPDDESVGCGGTIALATRSGAAVTVVFATDGEATRGASAAPGVVGARRRDEAERACRTLGASARFLGLADGSLRPDELDAGALVEELHADVVLVPWFGDGHRDHRAVSHAVAESSAPDILEVWAFETWTPLPANRLVDITSAVEAKRSAIATHVSAHDAFDLGAMLGLNRYRSLHGLMGRGYAEAFLTCDLGRYRELVARYGACPTP